MNAPGAQVAVSGKRDLTKFQAAMLALHKQAMLRIHDENRRVLTSDDMVDATNVRPHYEAGDAALHIYFFTIDCIIRGEKVHGALFAGELMMVEATSMRQAQELAGSGLESTIELMHEEFNTREQRELDNANDEGLAISLIDPNGNIGSRMKQAQSEGKIAVNPKLQAELSAMLAGKPKQ